MSYHFKILLLGLQLLAMGTMLYNHFCLQPNPQSIQQTPLAQAFESPLPIVIAVSFSLGASSCTGLDLLFDFLFRDQQNQTSLSGISLLFERYFIFFVLTIPNILILVEVNSPSFIDSFICMYSIQNIGSLIPVFCMCHQFFPSFFKFYRLIFAYVAWVVGLFYAYITVGKGNCSWMVSFFCMGGSTIILTEMGLSWLKSLYFRLKNKSLESFLTGITEEEFLCLLFLSTSFFCNFLPFLILGAICSFRWESCSTPVLSFGLFNWTFIAMIQSGIPARIIRGIKAQQGLHEMLRYIAHEIRSPLNVLVGGISLLLSGLLRQDFNRKSLLKTAEDIQHASQEAVNITDDILNFEKFRGGAFVLEQQKMAAAAFFERITNQCKILAEDKNITLRFCVKDDSDKVDANELEVNIDPLKMEQVMRNLIVNAIKFTPSGGKITVSISFNKSTTVPSVLPPAQQREHFHFLRRVKVCFCELFLAKKMKVYSLDINNNDMGVLQVDVLDSGEGMTKDQRDRLFQQFVQFNAAKLQGGRGSGLGLWISNNILKQHGSELSCYSSGIGEGTTFSFWLEAAVASTQECRARSTRGMQSQQLASSLTCNTLPRPGWARLPSPMHATTPFFQSSFSPEAGAARVNAHSRVRSPSTDMLQVLIVDDSKLNRKFIRRMINSASTELKNSHQCCLFFCEADDGVSAVEKVQAGARFDIIFLDNIMLKMNGSQAAKILRADLKYSGTIVGVTGSVSEADINEFIYQGADAVLTKPISKEKLVLLLQTILPKKSAA